MSTINEIPTSSILQQPQNGEEMGSRTVSETSSVVTGLSEYDGILVLEEEPRKSYNYFSLFRFSSAYEQLFLILGLFCAFISGVCVPLMVWQFGKLTNTMLLIDIVNDTNYNSTFLIPIKPTKPFCEPEDKILILEETREHPDKRTKIIVQSINEFAAIHTYVAIALTILSAIYFICWFYCGEKQINRLSVTYFESLLRKDMKWLDTHQDHDFANSIIENTNRIRDGIGERISIAIALCSIFICSLTNAFWHGWKLTLVSMISIPVLLISTAIVASAEANQIIEEQNAYSKAGSLAEEVLLNVRTVMVYGGQKKEFKQFCEHIDGNKLKVIKRTIITSIANGIMWFITYGNYALSFWFGTKLVLESQTSCVNEKYSPEDLVIIFFSIYFGALNIGLAFPILQSIFVANKSSQEVLETIDTKVEVDNLSEDGFKPNRGAIGSIEIQDVYFSYPARKDVPVLNGVSLEVHPGETCALVGTSEILRMNEFCSVYMLSGCGKSTILKLLTKEYLADSGFIKIDGVDVRLYNTSWLRSQMAFVTQEGSLFDGTIEENIRYGRPDATFEEIQKVCQEANAHDFICQMKNGYQTVIGFQGGKLSGGQRQRLAICRALLRDPKILLLDEPTSALDNQSEAIVQEALQIASKDRTTFVVAHRLNTIKNADKILVFDKGKIVEQGTHSQLLEQKGIYYGLATGKNRAEPSKKLHDPTTITRRKSLIEDGKRQRRESMNRRSSAVEFPFRAASTTASPFNENIIRNIQRLSDMQRKDSQGEKHYTVTINPKRQRAVSFAGENTNKNEVIDIEEEVDEQRRYTSIVDDGRIIISKKDSDEHALQIVQAESILWNNYVENDNPAKKIDVISPDMKFSFCTILKMTSRSRFLIFIGVIASILVGCTLPLYGFLFGEMIGELSSLDQSNAKIKFEELSFEFAIVGAAAAVFVFGQSMALNLAGYVTVDRMRKLLFFTFLRQDCGWFDDPENNVATLNTRLSIDAGSTQYIILSFYGALFQCFATIFVSIGYSAWFGDPMLTLYCLFLVPIVIGSSFIDGWLGKIQQDRTSKAMDEVSKLVLEVFQNRHAVMTCQLETHFLEKYKKLLLSTGKSKFSLIFWRSIAFGFAQASVFWAYSICMYLSQLRITSDGPDRVKYKDVLKVGEGLIFGLLTVGSNLAIIPSFVNSLSSGDRLMKLLIRKPNFDVDVDGLSVKKCNGEVVFKDVQFWYPHAVDNHILRGINFTLSPGKMIGLVGSSGSGKSTCAQLILRFHDATGGSVSIDGANITDLNCASLRSFMALVEQEPRLFDRSVAANIGYGDNSKPIRMTQIIKAAKAANIHTFVTSLPEGYETKTGPSSGSFLSGGQKQRVAIARALLRNPKILILDEATSALDRDSEKLVQASLEIARSGRSCIAIAHRLVSIQKADLIIVLHQGNIVEFGNHETLIQQQGLYSVLWASQNSAPPI